MKKTKKKIKIYLAGRTSFVKKHENLKNYLLDKLDCEIFLPHELVSVDVPKEKLPEEAFTNCIEHMNEADIIVADINIYGKDTAWEIGYCFGLNKKIIGYAKNEAYKRDFMVRGALTYITKDEEEIVQLIKKIYKNEL